ncbi:unnamed protein product [Euphydryas editha]|uniref:THAP-type domain-containing protein n=1 Tax=Euphydryas editha TaxID=104508 RepID=A0AAU9UGP6_EUPED|nr:unnamed protein product [Euphydryas editha]
MSKSRAYCIVDGCQNQTTNKSLSFFKLPKDEERRNKWLKIIGRSDLMNRKDLKPGSYIVCSVHFEKNMIFMTPRLHPDAMPTKYLPSQPSTSTSTSEMESSTIDTSTQTEFSKVNNISIENIKDTTCETSAVKTEEINVDEKTQTSISLSQDTPEIRKLRDNSQDSEQKRRRLEREIVKIEKEVQVKEEKN